MLNSNVCGYNDAYILVKGTITFARAAKTKAARVKARKNKQAIFKSCDSFTDCIGKINNTHK